MNFPLGFTAGNEGKAYKLAEEYHFTISNEIFPRLNLTTKRLELLISGFSPLFVDFESQILQKRKLQSKNQGLIKACKAVKGSVILDATAGWGRDSALLYSLGAHIIMLERSPIMAALLADGIERLTIDEHRCGSIKLIHADSKDYLANLEVNDYPDIIYIDPMHPVRQKSALVKKDMQALQLLFGEDLDALALINAAIGKAKSRVVVKWPQRATALLKPKHTISGSTVRFDLY